MRAQHRPQAPGITVYYDGDCPLCRSYTSRIRLKHSAGVVELVDARVHTDERRKLEQAGYRLDDGMVVQAGEQAYHGTEAVNVLALLSSRSGWFNRVNYRVFCSPRAAKVLYPAMVAGRRALLFLLGRKPLSCGEHEAPNNPNKLRKVP